MAFRLFFLCFVAGLTVGQANALTIYKYTDANGVVTYTDKKVSGASVFEFRDEMVERFEQQVELETQSLSGVKALWVRNDLHAPVEIQLAINQTVNVIGVPAKPIRKVIPPRSRLHLATLIPKVAGKPMRYKPYFDYSIGSPGQDVAFYRYPLPWIGGPYRMTQGPNGRFSHTSRKGRYAIDIAMPVGTPIVSAREGTVVKVENNQNGRGTHPSGNFVRILHDDGTMAVYLHLKQHSVLVKEGQRVGIGTLLAQSGNTGRSTGPHLHFAIQRNSGMGLESIPFEFAQPVDSLPNFAVAGSQ